MRSSARKAGNSWSHQPISARCAAFADIVKALCDSRVRLVAHCKGEEHGGVGACLCAGHFVGADDDEAKLKRVRYGR